MGAIFTIVLGWVARYFGGAGAALWLGRFLFVTILGALFILTYNFLVDLMQECFAIFGQLSTQAVSDSGTGSQSWSPMQIYGIAAYLAHHLRLVEIFTFAVNIITLKTLLRFLPIRWIFGR